MCEFSTGVRCRWLRFVCGGVWNILGYLGLDLRLLVVQWIDLSFGLILIGSLLSWVCSSCICIGPYIVIGFVFEWVVFEWLCIGIDRH